jgi:hypothetical protein
MGFIVEIVGLFFNRPEIPPAGKWADKFLPYLSCATAFNSPSAPLFIGLTHVLFK